MRITAEEKLATRLRIVDEAKKLFRTNGFASSTTRDIAKAAGIASGTMFNYFPTKEAVVVEIATQAFEKAAKEFSKHRRENTKIEEDLFALVAVQLRQLRSLRTYIRPLLDSALSPSVAAKVDDPTTCLRTDLVEQFSRILIEHGIDDPSPVQLQIFWSLFVGILTFWGTDKSPKQEDSLALLDQSIRMYANWLGQ